MLGFLKRLFGGAPRPTYGHIEIWLSKHIKPTSDPSDLKRQLEEIYQQEAKKYGKDHYSVKGLRKYIDKGIYLKSPFLLK